MKAKAKLLEDSDIKFIVDGKGNKKEVIISYAKFVELMQIIEDHIFLHSPEIQEQIKQSKDDLASGRYVEFDSDKIDEMLDWLHSEE
jgi:PHD/YefM family antitoxin component YafN of YafNO toxin-antitoxin module